MTTEPIKLVEHKPKDNASAIALLEEILLEAKAGIVQEVLIVSFRPDGKFKTDASERKSNLVTIGALEFLKQDLIAYAAE